MHKAVFLDRDGVLNVDTGYVYKIEDFQWIPGAQQAIKYLNDRGFLVIVVTNQSGVARGYYGEQDIQILHQWMNDQLASYQAHIDRFYYCPHHPEGQLEQYRIVCECRKPQPGLIVRAVHDWKIDVGQSLLIGDSLRDIQAAKQAGMKGYLFQEHDLYEFIKHVLDDWSE